MIIDIGGIGIVEIEKVRMVQCLYLSLNLGLAYACVLV